MKEFGRIREEEEGWSFPFCWTNMGLSRMGSSNVLLGMRAYGATEGGFPVTLLSNPSAALHECPHLRHCSFQVLFKNGVGAKTLIALIGRETVADFCLTNPSSLCFPVL